jgi:hypothetical protein
LIRRGDDKVHVGELPAVVLGARQAYPTVHSRELIDPGIDGRRDHMDARPGVGQRL